MNLAALVISDSPVSRTNARRALESAGFAVTLARADEDFQHAGQGHGLKVVVVALPEPARLAALRRLNQTPGMRSLPVLVTVESSESPPRVRALRAGAQECVTEPYDAAFFGPCVAGLAIQGPGGRARAPDAPGRVLIVDDSATYSSALAEGLRHDGHDVVAATGAAEAQALLALEPVDVVVLDVFMPEVGGVELCARIRAAAATAGVPILMLTGRKDSTIKETGLAAGADDFVVKSGDFEVIREHVGALLRGEVGRGHRITPLPHPPAPPARMPSSPALKPTAFVDRVVAATGLSALMGRSSVVRACARAGVAPDDLSPDKVGDVLPFLEQALKVFSTPADLAARLSAVAALAHADPDEHD